MFARWIAARLQPFQRRARRVLNTHPNLRLFFQNLASDNVGVLAGFVSWSILTAIIPLSVGAVGVAGLFVHSTRSRADLVSALSRLFQGAISTGDIDTAVKAVSSHSGLLGAVGALGVLWGASNIGGSFSTGFRIIFDTRPRPFLREKLIDVGMIFVFTGLMGIVLYSTTATAFLDHLAAALPFPEVAQVAIAAAISLFSAFLMFSAIYSVFPNIEAGDKLTHVWLGALPAAILFEVVSTVWPLYVRFSHASRFGAVLFSLLVLTAWIYAFSVILILGAEVLAVASLRDRRPPPQRNHEEGDPLDYLSLGSVEP